MLIDTTQWRRWDWNPQPLGLESSTLPLPIPGQSNKFLYDIKMLKLMNKKIITLLQSCTSLHIWTFTKQWVNFSSHTVGETPRIKPKTSHSANSLLLMNRATKIILGTIFAEPFKVLVKRWGSINGNVCLDNTPLEKSV